MLLKVIKIVFFLNYKLSVFPIFIPENVEITPVPQDVNLPAFNCLPDSTSRFLKMKAIMKPAFL